MTIETLVRIRISRKNLVIGLWSAFVGGWTLLLTFNAPLGRLWMPIILWRYLQFEIAAVLLVVTLYILREPLLAGIKRPLSAINGYRKAWGVSWGAVFGIVFVAFVLAAPANKMAGAYVLDSVRKLTASRTDYYNAVFTDAYAYGLARQGYADVREGRLEAGLKFYEEAMARTAATGNDHRFYGDAAYLKARISFARNQHDRAEVARKIGLTALSVALDIDALRANPGHPGYLDAVMSDIATTRSLQGQLRSVIQDCRAAGDAAVDDMLANAFEPVGILVGPTRSGPGVCNALSTVCSLSSVRCATAFETVLGIAHAERACQIAAERADLTPDDRARRCTV